jgi:hypothetical protein
MKHHVDCFCDFCCGQSKNDTGCECLDCNPNQFPNNLKENKEMAMPNPSQRQRGKLPKPARDESGYSPFLKVEDLAKKGTTSITLQGGSRQAHSKFGEQIIVPIKLGNKKYDWAVNLTSGNYVRLYNRFGDDDKKWVGKVKVQVAENLDKKYIQVTD